MERLHSVIISMAGFDETEPVGHLVVVTREDGVTVESLDVALEGHKVPPTGDARQWAKSVLAMALAEL